jgi:hypothetical protein
MKRRSSIIFGLILISILTAWLVYSKVYNKPHRQIAGEQAAYAVKSVALFGAYETDEEKADSLYNNKVIQVEGKVENILQNEQGETTLVLTGNELFGISCTMADSEKEKLKKIKTGSEVKLKGLCNGMLMDVVLVKCVLIE